MSDAPAVVAGLTVESEVAERVRLELLVRQEVERQTKKPAERTSAKDVLQHPAVLLLITFALTGVGGSIVTSWWQYQQWSRQQQYRASQESTKEQLAVMNLTAQAVAESFAGAEDVLHLFAWEWRADSSVVTLPERAAHWTQQSRRWRTNEKILLARSKAAFNDPRVEELMKALIRSRRFLGNDITNLLALADANSGRKYSPADREEIKKLSESALKRVNEVTGSDGILPKLIAVMLEESRETNLVPPPKPLWRWLWSS